MWNETSWHLHRKLGYFRSKIITRQYLVRSQLVCIHLATLFPVKLHIARPKVFELVIGKLSLLCPHFGPDNFHSMHPWRPKNFTVNSNIIQICFNKFHWFFQFFLCVVKQKTDKLNLSKLILSYQVLGPVGGYAVSEQRIKCTFSVFADSNICIILFI